MLIWAILIGGFGVRVACLDSVASPLPTKANVLSAVAETSDRCVYVPYDVEIDEAAIFWFGQVTLGENYTDVRIWYTDDSLFLSLGIIDRLLWYDTTPSPGELTAWDSVSLYLSQDGNVGDTPDANSYRFDAQLAWWETNYQVAYQGNGSDWVIATILFTTTYGWNGTVPNDNSEDDRGWMLYYEIPFTSLGFDGPPAQGALWGLGVAVHDRDSEAGLPLADQIWPEMMVLSSPATWGQLYFGLKPAYAPAPALPRAMAIIRHGLDGAEVIDADVGGSSVCGVEAEPDGYFPTWGNLNYPGKEFLNIQHLDPISEWPCFSKYFVTFPLDSLPAGKVVLSATLTLYHFGNAGEGWDPGPQPSFIQVFTIDEDWEESSLTWNNAPLAGDYIAATWVDPFDESPPPPGIPRHWDVSGAVAAAYAAGTPLRLALYSPDWAFHSGKYFRSSDFSDEEGRPTLTVAWGDPAATVAKTAAPRAAAFGDIITYTLGIVGDGGSLILTDTLPLELSHPLTIMWLGTSISPVYDSDTHRLLWSVQPSAGVQLTITYDVEVTTHTPSAATNVAVLSSTDDGIDEASVTVILNPYRLFLPLIVKCH
ncbi:MAG: DNRLRE domain-containing protein [Anaerolineae bacterium]|nr:DNRLRE domain-containing protein [Anaerolineae bacterium]